MRARGQGGGGAGRQNTDALRVPALALRPSMQGVGTRCEVAEREVRNELRLFRLFRSKLQGVGEKVGSEADVLPPFPVHASKRCHCGVLSER